MKYYRDSRESTRALLQGIGGGWKGGKASRVSEDDKAWWKADVKCELV